MDYFNTVCSTVATFSFQENSEIQDGGSKIIHMDNMTSFNLQKLCYLVEKAQGLLQFVNRTKIHTGGGGEAHEPHLYFFSC